MTNQIGHQLHLLTKAWTLWTYRLHKYIHEYSKWMYVYVSKKKDSVIAVWIYSYLSLFVTIWRPSPLTSHRSEQGLVCRDPVAPLSVFSAVGSAAPSWALSCRVAPQINVVTYPRIIYHSSQLSLICRGRDLYPYLLFPFHITSFWGQGHGGCLDPRQCYHRCCALTRLWPIDALR